MVQSVAARDFGEVFTPHWMVSDMLDSIKSDITDFTHTILDLCAGRGAFILEALDRRMKLTSTHQSLLDALATLYAAELQEVNVSIIKHEMMERVSPFLEDDELEKAKSIIDANIAACDVIESGIPFDIHFDAIVSNPPYQRNIAGTGTRNRSKSVPFYPEFWNLAKGAHPKRMVFIIPAKWYSGGWGLDAWRQEMLDDSHIVSLVDYRESHSVFEGVEVNGGVCWLLRDETKDNAGKVSVLRFNGDNDPIERSSRPLREEGMDIFVRDGQAVPILRRIRSFIDKKGSVSSMMLGTTPFGIPSDYVTKCDWSDDDDGIHDVPVYVIKRKTVWMPKSEVKRGEEAINEWKAFLPLCFNQSSPQVVGVPKVGAPGEACSHSYICVHGFSMREEAESFVSYTRTKAFRFIVFLMKISPVMTRKVYSLVPMIPWDREYDDDSVYRLFGLSDDEIQHVENSVE